MILARGGVPRVQPLRVEGYNLTAHT